MPASRSRFSRSVAPSSPASRGAWPANSSARCWCAKAAGSFSPPASSRSKRTSEKNDPASHSAAGNTARTAVLFGPPGYAYVYFIYGNHYCLNVSCERDGKAGGVLFRAVEPLRGIKAMARARKIEVRGPRDLIRLTSGPGRMAEAFGITRTRDNGGDLTSPHSSLWIGDDGFRARNIKTTPRIGITKAVDKRLRYILAGNAFVSGRKSPPEAEDRRKLDKWV
jgi:DNA-3-methyladenine glycosylase